MLTLVRAAALAAPGALLFGASFACADIAPGPGSPTGLAAALAALLAVIGSAGALVARYFRKGRRDKERK